jgi:hypothetical protein
MHNPGAVRAAGAIGLDHSGRGSIKSQINPTIFLL